MRQVGLLLCLACLCVVPSLASKKKDTKNDSYSVVAGTVFREPGLALPGAEVILFPEGEEPTGKKSKKMTYTANGRGEFAFHVPPVKARYNVKASAKGFKTQEKVVEVVPDERAEVTFMLAAESNK
jgi:hypothetical protein